MTAYQLVINNCVSFLNQNKKDLESKNSTVRKIAESNIGITAFTLSEGIAVGFCKSIQDVVLDIMKRKRDLLKTFSLLMGSELVSDYLIESDAGLEEIERLQKAEKDSLKAEKDSLKAEKDALKEKYKNVGRNDICLCGSGKKFKKCHILLV